MGFGLLFIGYLATYLLYLAGGYGCFPAIIGCFLMLYALTKLSEYEPLFKYAFFAVIPLTVCWGYFVAAEVALSFGTVLPGFLSSVKTQNAIIYARSFFDLLYHSALLLSIAKIAGDTGIARTRNAAIRNLIVYAAFVVAQIADFLTPVTSAYSLYVFLGVLIFWLMELILNSICIFSCYMRICDEGDQDMDAKPSKFKIINDLRTEYDRREAKAQKENREYRINKLQKRAERAKRKNKK